jgi:hypothetical protein
MLREWHRMCSGATPSPAFPYQDMTHFSSFSFGGVAAYTTWWELKQPGIATSWRFMRMAVVFVYQSTARDGLAVITQLLQHNEPVSYSGRFFQLQDAILQPRRVPVEYPFSSAVTGRAARSY